MEALGAASAILGISTAGVQCSIKLVTFAGQVKSAEDEITRLAEDVSLNASILQQLGELLKEGEGVDQALVEGNNGDHDEGQSNTNHPRRAIFNPTGLATVMKLAEMCKAIFHTLNDSIQKASAQSIPNPGTPGPIKLSRLAMLKWPFLKPETEALQAQLRDVKGTLMLMLQLAMLRYSRRMAEGGTSRPLNGLSHLSQADQELLVLSIGVAHKKRQESMRLHSENIEVDDLSNPNVQLKSLPPPDENKVLQYPPAEKKPSLLSRFCKRVLHSKANAVVPEDASARHNSERNSIAETPPHSIHSIQVSDLRSTDIEQQNFVSLSVAQSPPDDQDGITPFVNEAKANVQYLSPPKQKLTESEFQNGTSTELPHTQDSLEVRVFSPVACIKDRKIHVEYVHRAIRISQEAAEHQLAAWKSTSNDSVLNQLLALTTSEHEALETCPFSSSNYSKLGDEHLEWLDFGESLPLVDDVAHVRARTLTAVVKVSRRPQDKGTDADQSGKNKDEQVDTWMKVHRKYLCPETLTHYQLPWMEDEHDPNSIIVKQLISEAFQDELFAHSFRIHKDMQGNLEPWRRPSNETLAVIEPVVEPAVETVIEPLDGMSFTEPVAEDATEPSGTAADMRAETEQKNGHTEDSPRPNPEIMLQSNIDNGEGFENIVDELLARYTNE